MHRTQLSLALNSRDMSNFKTVVSCVGGHRASQQDGMQGSGVQR